MGREESKGPIVEHRTHLVWDSSAVDDCHERNERGEQSYWGEFHCAQVVVVVVRR